MGKFMFWIGMVALALGLFFGLGGYEESKEYFILKTVLSKMESEIDSNEDANKAIEIVRKGGDLGIMLLSVALPTIESHLILELEKKVEVDFDEEDELKIRDEFKRVIAKKLGVEPEVFKVK